MEEIPYILAHFRIRGSKGEVFGRALVDTGAAVTVIDETLANFIGVEPVGSTLKVKLRGMCCEVEGELVGINYLEIEKRAVGPTSVVKLKFPNEIKQVLKGTGARGDIIIGVRDLAIGFVVNIKKKKLEYVGPMVI